MEAFPYLDIVILLAILAVVGVFIYWTVTRHVRAGLPVQYTRRPPRVPYFIKTAEANIPFNTRQPDLCGQSPEWRAAMREIGQRFAQHRVSHIYFVHGTFAGDDPFSVIPALRRIFPKMSDNFCQSISLKMKRSFDRIQRDTANYLFDYVNLFQEAMDYDVNCQLFVWPSGNHHASRLRGALSLIRRLNEDLPDIPPSRLLLWGHSHAGQVFALFSHLLHNSPLGERLWSIAKDASWVDDSDHRRLQKLRKFKFDFVTFGTPVRYPWRLSHQARLVNVVNHRGDNHLAHSPFGFWKTQGGDYIQQWGILGSDYLASSPTERRVNRQLDRFLGLGIDPRGWVENVAKGMRVPDYGTTYLVDYRDQSLMVPNAFKTVFGHGVYTRFEHMLFNAKLTCDALYPIASPNFKNLARQSGRLLEKAENFLQKRN